MKLILLVCAAASLAFTEALGKLCTHGACFCSDCLTEKQSKRFFLQIVNLKTFQYFGGFLAQG